MEKEKLLTVKEYAAARGKSAQAVYNSIKAGKLQTIKQGSVTYIVVTKTAEQDKESSARASASFRAAAANTESSYTPAAAAVIETLTEQLKIKDKQINDLTETIKSLNETINSFVAITRGAQQLQAHAEMQLIETQSRAENAAESSYTPAAAEEKNSKKIIERFRSFFK